VDFSPALLTQPERDAIESAVAAHAVEGARYAEKELSMVNL
jgi:hypothetical protein